VIASQVAELIVADRMADRQASARTARIAALARCCQPSMWARTFRRARAAVARHHRGRPTAGLCCAGA